MVEKKDERLTYRMQNCVDFPSQNAQSSLYVCIKRVERLIQQ